MKIVCLGDSLTQGYGVSKRECWVSLLQKNTQFDWINCGVNGESSAEIMDRLRREMLRYHPDATMILCGVNDFIFSLNDEEIAFQHVRSMVQMLFEQNIRPVLGIPLPVIPRMARKRWFDGTDYDAVNEMILSYRDLLLAYGKQNEITLLDFYDVFRRALETKSDEFLYLDGLHPTAEGHILLYEAVMQSEAF